MPLFSTVGGCIHPNYPFVKDFIPGVLLLFSHLTLDLIFTLELVSLCGVIKCISLSYIGKNWVFSILHMLLSSSCMVRFCLVMFLIFVTIVATFLVSVAVILDPPLDLPILCDWWNWRQVVGVIGGGSPCSEYSLALQGADSSLVELVAAFLNSFIP